MALKNRAGRYGSVAKFFHWSIFLLILFQFFGANLMTRLGRGEAAFGFGGDAWYNGHKSIGLIVLGLAVGRLGSPSDGSSGGRRLRCCAGTTR